MALVKCESHGSAITPKKYTYSDTPYEPVGHPDSGLICGAESCRRPGLVWLTTTEEDEYRTGNRIFPVGDGSTKSAKLHVDRRTWVR